MARFNEILVGRFNKALTKLFSIKGASPAAQCSSEIQPVIELEQVALENRFPLSVDSFMTTVTQAGVAGQISTIKLRNPTGSNVIAVFEKVSVVSSGDSAQLAMGTDQSDGGQVVALVGSNNLDARSGRLSSLIFSRSQAAAPPGQQAIAGVGNSANVQDFILTHNSEVILSPGRSLQIQGQVANIQIIATFKWRERLLEESERQ